MRKRLLSILIVSLGLASGAQAGDAEFFEGLIPGEPLADEEMAQIHGKGAIVFDTELLNVLGTLDLSLTANQVSNIANNSGITTPIQFVGDNNQVSVNIAISVNIGTVSVINPVGSSVSASTAVDFTGALDLGLGR